MQFYFVFCISLFAMTPKQGLKKPLLVSGSQEENSINTKNNSWELNVRIDIPLKTVQIVGWRETCTRQGVPSWLDSLRVFVEGI